MKKSFGYSLSLHLGLLCLFLFSALEKKNLPPSAPEAIQVETISNEDFQRRLERAFAKKEKQLVQIDTKLKSEQAPDEHNDERTFYSSHNQRVDRNTRAARVGAFKNVMNSGREGPKSSQVSKLFELPSEEKTNPTPDAKEAPAPTGRLRAPAQQGEGAEGESATDDYLEDVAIGAQTILNAKEYRFYGFYARIREQLIYHWHQRLKAEVLKLENEGRPIVNTTRRTQVRIFLNASGTLQNIQLLGSSGLTELDRAATDAFRLAAPFAHPPKEMIGEDGLVPIRWEFVVVSSSDHGVQLRVERTGFR